MKRFLSTSGYLKSVFGQKIYKLSLSAANTCPNRDGTVGTGGCIFCSMGGSGDFATPYNMPINEQIENAKARLGDKGADVQYIAYFQSFTGTYGDLEYLEKIYTYTANRPDITALSIATRPDCLGDAVIEMLKRLSKIKPLWVELGLQTVNEDTARYINRGYALSMYDKAIERLKGLNVHIITHIILGLPGETKADMLKSVMYIGQKSDGVKLQLLHVLKGTALQKEYEKGTFNTLSKEE